MTVSSLPSSREDTIPMHRALKTLRVVQWLMLGSIVLYGIVGEVVDPHLRAVNPSVNYLFSTLAVAIIGAIFVVRRTLVFRAAASLADHPDDLISLNHWRTGYFASYALCDTLALFGFVLRFLGCSFQQSVPFYIGGFVLLFFFRPREPVSESST